ncbi:MAG TPA: hypothetical protein VK138_02710 [Acidiferrobacterales bacterium]|nr:hypothetical protein [Acidiferrobacterales bacterium]
MSGRPGTVVGCTCMLGAGFDTSAAAGGVAGVSCGCCAHTGGAMGKTATIVANKTRGRLDERAIMDSLLHWTVEEVNGYFATLQLAAGRCRSKKISAAALDLSVLRLRLSMNLRPEAAPTSLSHWA